jgi:hypothetical protein
MKTAAWRKSVLRALPRDALVRCARLCSLRASGGKRELVLCLAEAWEERGDRRGAELFRLDDLRRMARALGLSIEGSKRALVTRILAHPFRTFADARRYASALRLDNEAEWHAFCRGERPQKGAIARDVPIDPERAYCRCGWRSWKDFLGIGRIRSEPRHRTFEEARAWARSQLIASRIEWDRLAAGKLRGRRLPRDVPPEPDRVYANVGWNGWADWLESRGDGRFLAYEMARAFVHRLGLKNATEWFDYCSGRLPQKGVKPRNIPGAPHYVYLDKGWVGMGDWLGTGNVRGMAWRSYEDASAFARSLGIKSQTEWSAYVRGERPDLPPKPADIPAWPTDVYTKRGDWKGFGHFLGTGNTAPFLQRYRPFAEARSFAHGLELTGKAQWEELAKASLPGDVPKRPDWVYKHDGWAGWSDWVGGSKAHKRRKHAFRTFDEARELARSLGLSTEKEWREWARGRQRPRDIPIDPRTVYSDRFTTFGDWLGTGKLAVFARSFRSYDEAREFARALELKHMGEWLAYCRGQLAHKPPLPSDVPVAVWRVYARQGFRGMPDFLGTPGASYQKQFMSFDDARAYVHALGLRKRTDWEAFIRGRLHDKGARPPNIPAQPYIYYRHQGWCGWDDWLGVPLA